VDGSRTWPTLSAAVAIIALVLSRAHQVRRLRGVERDLSSLQGECAGHASSTRWIGWIALALSVASIVLASVAIATKHRHTQAYLSIAVAATVAVSLVAVFVYVARRQIRIPGSGPGGRLEVLLRQWRYLAAATLSLALGVTLALTIDLEAKYILARGERGETGRRGETGPRGEPGHTTTIYHVTNRTVTVSRTVYVTSPLPYTK
jgi:hypothetical protein